MSSEIIKNKKETEKIIESEEKSITDKRDEFAEQYPENITKIATALEAYASMKEFFSKELDGPGIDKIMERLKSFIDSASSEEIEMAQKFLKERREEGL